MRSAIPVMPNGPAFVDKRAYSPDVSSLAHPDHQTGLSAEEFLAQIASTPEYQASQYFESTATSSTCPAGFEQMRTGSRASNQHFERPLYTAMSTVADDHIDESTNEHQTTDSAATTSSATASPAPSVLAAKAPGFSSVQRSRAASLSRRKAPPTPLVLTSSPATSNSDTLPGSASGRRRRSLTATINPRSPLSAPHSNRSSTCAPSPGKTATSAGSASGSSSDRRQHDSGTDYSEPLRTAFYDFDIDDDGDEDDTGFKPSSRSDSSPPASTALAMSSTVSTWTDPQSMPSARPESNVIMDRIMSESRDSQLSALSSRVRSMESSAQTRESSGSEAAAAFEFADLETEPSSEGLSLQTMMGFLQRQDSQKTPSASLMDDLESESDEQERALYPEAESTMKQAPALQGEAEASSSFAPPSPAGTQNKQALITTPAPAASEVPSFNISIFGPGQATEAKLSPAPHISIDPRFSAEGAEGPAGSAPSGGATLRPRKQSMVPAPPSFAIRDASRETPQNGEAPLFLTSISDDLEVAPVLAGAESNEGPAGNSRWSSGSESDGESALSTKGAGRKSFSKGRKSFSASRKNSVAITRELNAAPAMSKEGAPEVGRRQSKQSSKSRLSAQGAAPQTLPVPTKPPATSFSKRLLLNGLPSLRKKSFSNLNSQSASPSTPSSAGPAFFNRTEFPFPPPTSPQVMRSPPIPSTTSQPLDGNDAAGLMIRTASATTFASASQLPVQSPQTPVSAPHFASSNGASGPLTTQQILAQARNNVWPENYIGTSVSAAGMSSPYLSAAHDTFSHNFAPSRLAPTPPYSAAASTSRMGWPSTPHTPPMPQSPRLASNRTSKDKSLPSTPVDGPAVMSRSRSRNNEIAPPQNLRHMRQSSSNTNLDKLRKDVPADVFRPKRKGDVGANVAPPEAQAGQAVPTPSQDMDGTEEKLAMVAEGNADPISALTDSPAPIAAELDASLPLPVPVDRRRAKMHKARRIREQGDRFPRYNSWSEFGLQWVAEQGADAFDMLAAENLPSKAILVAAGASSGKSNRLVTGGSGGGGGEDDSDGSDTDDYGSSDGAGGAGGGGFGGAGGGGGGRQPDRNGADDTDDASTSSSEDDEDAGAVTDDESDDVYGESERSAAARAARGAVMPTVPARGASMSTSQVQAEEVHDSDSSDDRPLGLLVDDLKALQKALRTQERKRHFALAAQALEGKGSSSASPSTASHARHAGQGQTSDTVVSPNDLAQRLAKVQSRRERAQAPNAAVMQRSQTVARQDVSRTSDRRQQPDAAAVSRSKSVCTTPAERYVHPGMRARTPSEAALRAKAMAQAMPQGPSPISPTLPSVAKMPELPSNAMATVVAAQKAMALAQANPTPAALAQAQALASSATAALNAATAQVKRGGSSPISPSFNQGDPVGHVSTSPRIADGAELPGARLRTGSRAHAFPVASSGGASAAAPAVATPNNVGMLQRLRSRSISRNQVPLSINTAAAPPMPDMPRPSTASKDSQASSSPHNAHAPTFAALSQAAMHHGRPSVDASATPSEGHAGQMQRAASNLPGTLSNSHDSGAVSNVAPAEPRQPHKVFILSRQRFTVVEVPVSARARDLALEVIEREKLPMDDSKGGWVVFDCSSQLGIERPLREYEVITDLVNVRAHPQTDFFLIKRTELSPYLSIRSVPSSSPALAGYVYVQDRKKKWNKRWLELRDHALYHAKNEKGKDETSVCQISTFDVYLVDSSAIKMPKANGFALRSQDPITMFEKPDQDYIHYFCLSDPAAHRDWVRAILNARTYILRQEKAVLFQIDSPPSSHEVGQPGVIASGGLSRKNTSRRPNGRPAAAAAETGASGATGPSPPTPLIDSNAFAGPFAKGSLLADKAISDAKEALRGHAAAPPTGALHDLSLMDRNAVRMNEARRKEEAIERQRRMKADGQPLIDLARR
ncbi:hypothetical protein NDA16_003386 [Ustilago loliicola]|nr:hypothetical protein NDA16_003386 [Ustilago loliicola]